MNPQEHNLKSLTRNHRTTKHRLTFYASETTFETLNSLLKERGENSMTSLINQLIREYGQQLTITELEKRVIKNALTTEQEIDRLESEITILRNWIAGVEKKNPKSRRS